MLWVSVKGFDLFKPFNSAFIPLDCVVFVVSNRWCWLSLLSLHVNTRDDMFFSFYPIVLSVFALWPWMGLFRKRETLSWRLLHLLIAAPEVVKIMAEAAQSKGRGWWRCVPPASGVMVSRERKTAASLPLSLALCPIWWSSVQLRDAGPCLFHHTLPLADRRPFWHDPKDLAGDNKASW